MTSPEPAVDAQSSPWFASRPALSPVPASAALALPVAAPAATAGGPGDAATPIYDSLVVALGDPFSRLGPTRARQPLAGASGTEH